MYTVIMHVANEDPFVAEMDELPDPADQAVIFSNPRKRDGKPLPYIDREAVTFMYPWHRINFIEVLAPQKARDEIIEFFRED